MEIQNIRFVLTNIVGDEIGASDKVPLFDEYGDSKNYLTGKLTDWIRNYTVMPGDTIHVVVIHRV